MHHYVVIGLGNPDSKRNGMLLSLLYAVMIVEFCLFIAAFLSTTSTPLTLHLSLTATVFILISTTITFTNFLTTSNLAVFFHHFSATRHNVGKDLIINLARKLRTPFHFFDCNCSYTKPIQLSSLPPEILSTVYLNIDKTHSEQAQSNQCSRTPSNSIQDSKNDNKVDESARDKQFNASLVQPAMQPSPSHDESTRLAIDDQTDQDNQDKQDPQNTHQHQHKESKQQAKLQQLLLTPTQLIPIPHHVKPQNPLQVYASIPNNIYITLATSESFMNSSGVGVEQLAEKLQLESLSQVIIVHDDMDTKFGQMKIKEAGTGGHNGVRDIVKTLGKDAAFLRCLIGIGRPTSNQSVIEFVMKKFTRSELASLDFVHTFFFTVIAQAVLYPVQRANNHVQNMYHEYLQASSHPPGLTQTLSTQKSKQITKES